MNTKAVQQDFEILLAGLPLIHSISEQQEQDLARSKNPDDKIMLVLGHMREAFFYLRQCCRAQIYDRELYSICYKALVDCARTYRPNLQRFFAYSKPNLRGNISRHWKSQDTVRNASMHETEVSDWEQMDRLLDEKARSQKITYEDGNQNQEGHQWEDMGKELRQLIPMDYAEPDFDGINFRERLGLVKKVIADKLNAQEQMVIELAFTGGYSFEQIGQLLEPKVSRSAIQQTCQRALKKITNELRRRKQLF